MKREKYIVLGLMTVISILAIFLNKDMEFAITTGIGYVLMMAISFVRYEWIEKVRYQIVGMWVLAFVILRFIPLNIPVKYMSVEILALVLLPVAATLLDNLKWKKVAWIAVGLLTAVKIFVRPGIHWSAFTSKKGDVAYIYEQISKFNHGSQFFGSSKLAGDLTAYLPETKTGTILTAYGVEYGIIIKIVICVLLAGLIGKVIYDMIKSKSRGYLCAMGSVLAIGVETLVVILQNIPAVPYKGLVTFLPFFSDSIGGLVVCYLMMGLVLCTYTLKRENKLEK